MKLHSLQPLVCLTAVLMLGGAGGCVQFDDQKKRALVPLKVGHSRFEKPLQSWKTLREKNVVMQGYDYSCGAAALATLMQFYFQENITEEELLQEILGRMTIQELVDRQRNGLSLLDLKEAAIRRGYQAMAVKLTYAALTKLKGPILVHLQNEDYKHFAVLRGAVEDRIVLADPSRGNARLSVERFAKEWTGVALVLGRKGFGLPAEHPLAFGKDESWVQNEIDLARRAVLHRNY